MFRTLSASKQRQLILVRGFCKQMKKHSARSCIGNADALKIVADPSPTQASAYTRTEVGCFTATHRSLMGEKARWAFALGSAAPSGQGASNE
jgi:hypothetical protein